MRAALVLICTAAAFGQIAAPRLGYVPEGPRIRVMNGIPAAGSVGDYLDVGRNLGLIAVSPRQDYILATAADTGEVLLIVPGRAPVSVAGADIDPKIIVSPDGSAAVLLYEGRAQILTGLPNSPSSREVSVGDVTGAAISDDGTLAEISSILLPDGPPVALAYFRKSSVLVAVNATSIYTVQNAVATKRGDFDGDMRLLTALAVTADNRRVVLADVDGRMRVVDLVTNEQSTAACECLIETMSGIGGSLFRLTESGMGGVKLFDAATGRLYDVPRALSSAIEHHPSLTRRVNPLATPPLPTVSIGGLPATSGPAQQPAMTISLASTYSLDVTGTATLTFASSVGGDDQTIQFGTGGRTVNFTIPAGSTQASFSGKPNVAVLTGTVAGTITIKLSLNASGTDVTPTPPPTATIALVTTVPFIQSTQLQQSTGGFAVVITGFSTTRDMVSGLFHFAPSSNATLAASDVTVQLGAAFTTWYSNTASNALGSQFLLTVPFTTQNGLPGNIVAVTVTLTNSKGSSTPSINQ
jgi:hypothetical protein